AMAMPRRFIRRDNWEFGGQPTPAEGTSGEPKSRKRRLATTLVFTTIFFAGASLAAVAGNQFSPLTGEDSQQLAGDTTTTDGTPPVATDDTSAAVAAPVDAGAGPADASTDATVAADPSATPTGATSDATPVDDTTPPTNLRGPSTAGTETIPTATGPKQSAKQTAKAARGWKATNLRTILLPKLKPAPPPEIEGPPSAATIWLNSQLPDPTPPALRLSPKFATNLKATAKASGL